MYCNEFRRREPDSRTYSHTRKMSSAGSPGNRTVSLSGVPCREWSANTAQPGMLRGVTTAEHTWNPSYWSLTADLPISALLGLYGKEVLRGEAAPGVT